MDRAAPRIGPVPLPHGRARRSRTAFSYLLLAAAIVLLIGLADGRSPAPEPGSSRAGFLQECVHRSCSDEEVSETGRLYTEECINEGCDIVEVGNLAGNLGSGARNRMLTALLAHGFVIRDQDLDSDSTAPAALPPANASWLYTECNFRGFVIQANPSRRTVALPPLLDPSISSVSAPPDLLTVLSSGDREPELSILGRAACLGDPLWGFDNRARSARTVAAERSFPPGAEREVPRDEPHDELRRRSAPIPAQTYPVGWGPWIGDLIGWRSYDPMTIDGVGVLEGMQDGEILGYLLKERRGELLAPGDYIYVYRLNLQGSSPQVSPTAILYRRRGDESFNRNYIRHSQIASGEPVFCAGTFMVQPVPGIEPISSPISRITEATSASGHFKPPGCLCLQGVLQKLQSLGIDTDGTIQKFRTEDPRCP